VVSVTNPYGRILGFLDRSRYSSIKQLLSCTHETEWTPFKTHCFSQSKLYAMDSLNSQISDISIIIKFKQCHQRA
jgi:hypothetical protein